MQLDNELLFLTPDKNALAGAEGGYARGIIVLLRQETPTAAHRDFLAKVLAAVQLDLDKDTLWAELPPAESRLIAPDLSEKTPKQVLLFGVRPAQLGLSFEAPLYQPVAFYGCTWLFADSLSVLEPDKAKKTQLWSALKQIFM